MKKLTLTLFVFFAMVGLSRAAEFSLSASIEFLAPFAVSDEHPIDFGQLYLIGATPTIKMDINALTATAAGLAAAQAQASAQSKLVKITSNDVPVTPVGAYNAGYVIIKSNLSTLNLQLSCTQLPSPPVTGDQPLTGHFDISGGNGKVVITSIVTNLDEINAGNAFVVGATDHMPLYFAPSIDVNKPEYGKVYTDDLDFTLVLQ